MVKNYTLRFRTVNSDIYEAIIDGTKKVETRAATSKYRAIAPGDTVTLVCGSRRSKKTVAKVSLFDSVEALVKQYDPEEINPSISTFEELAAMYESFPGYREKIKKCGLVAFEFE
jgi:ASC-1-like (ASCH) protein